MGPTRISSLVRSTCYFQNLQLTNGLPSQPCPALCPALSRHDPKAGRRERTFLRFLAGSRRSDGPVFIDLGDLVGDQFPIIAIAVWESEESSANLHFGNVPLRYDFREGGGDSDDSK